jgi:lipopolysaccharide/colanic/teichoic acid biosynthesis glycosyltransferase
VTFKYDRGLDTKRGFDLVVSGLMLLVTWPLLLAVAVAVRVDSKGPALFRQERVGLDGETFRIHKFRSMSVEHDGALVSGTRDGRVTRVGRFLRRSKLDELPQIFDVFVGCMSLVGPRPEVPIYVDMWPADMRPVILSVRPGITDPASIAMRNEAEELAAAEDPERHYIESLLPRKAAMYVDYVRSRSFTGDLAIIGRTLATVIRD